jgi:hypothetical protein
MSTLNTGLLVMSAVASGSGFPSLSESVLKLRQTAKKARRAARRGRMVTPLSAHQKEELLQSILHDDWRE